MTEGKFVVLTSSRTGSTWLIDLLNMCPQIEAHGELFLNEVRMTPQMAGRNDYPRFVERFANPGMARILRVFEYLDGLYAREGIIGFKLMYSQIRAFPETLLYLAIKRLRIVHLVRRNLIDVLISEELARLTGRSHMLVDSRHKAVPVYLDPRAILSRIQNRYKREQQARHAIQLIGCPAIEVSYEDLLAGVSAFSRLFELLGIPEVKALPASHLKKRGGRTHREAISNYEEIRQVLIGTKFAKYLE